MSSLFTYVNLFNITNRFGYKPFYVSFGSNSLFAPRSSVKTKAVHLQYENNTGLIELEEDIIFSENVQPVKLPKSSSDLIGDSVVIAGWGTYMTGVRIK